MEGRKGAKPSETAGPSSSKASTRDRLESSIADVIPLGVRTRPGAGARAGAGVGAGAAVSNVASNVAIVAQTAPGGKKASKPAIKKGSSADKEAVAGPSGSSKSSQALLQPKITSQHLKQFFQDESADFLPPLPDFENAHDRTRYVWAEYRMILRLWEELSFDPRELTDYNKGLEEYRESCKKELGEKKDFEDATAADFYVQQKTILRNRKRRRASTLLDELLPARYGIPKLPPPKPKNSVGKVAKAPIHEGTNHSHGPLLSPPPVGPNAAIELDTNGQVRLSNSVPISTTSCGRRTRNEQSSSTWESLGHGSSVNDSASKDPPIVKPAPKRSKLSKSNDVVAAPAAVASTPLSAAALPTPPAAAVLTPPAAAVRTPSYPAAPTPTPSPAAEGPLVPIVELDQDDNMAIALPAGPSAQSLASSLPVPPFINTILQTQQQYEEERKEWLMCGLPDHLSKVTWRSATYLRSLEGMEAADVAGKLKDMRNFLVEWCTKAEGKRRGALRCSESMNMRSRRCLKDHLVALDAMVLLSDGYQKTALAFVQQMLTDYWVRANQEAEAEDQKEVIVEHSYGETPPSSVQLAKTKHVSRSHVNLSASTPAILTGTTTSSKSSSSCGSGPSFLSKPGACHNFLPTTLTYYNNNHNVFGSTNSFFSTSSLSTKQKTSRAKSFLFRPGSSATLPSSSTSSASSSSSSMTRHPSRHSASVKAPSIPDVNGGSAQQVAPGHNRAPNPRRMAVIADALSAGLAACVAAAHEDVLRLREIVECGKADGGLEPRAGKLFESERELKRAEHELKLGELARSQVERLVEDYNIQGRLREGARAMAAAFANGPSMRRKGSAVDRVRSGYWECVNAMSELEARLEGMVGMFHCQIQGIQGFARLCPGDVFELSFRHSRQKWKTRGRVCKDGSQTWDHPRASFKAVCFAEDSGLQGEYVPGSGAAGSPAVLTVKAREIKRGPLGQKVLLGRQDCDLLRLMAPRPIALSLPLNQSGSLKLTMLVVWRPLDASLFNGTLGMSTHTLSTLPSSTSTSALPLVGRSANGSGFLDHAHGGINRHRHWSHQTSSGSAGSSSHSGKYPSDEENTGSSNRSTDEYFGENHDSYEVGDILDGHQANGAEKKLNNLNNNGSSRGRRRHESLPTSEASDRDNMTLSSSSLSRNTGSSSRDENSSYANTMSWSGSDSHGTLDRGSTEATDECSSCVSSSLRSARSASISHPPRPSAPVPPERRFGLPTKVIPSDPLDLNFTLTKRPDWGMNFGLKDRFMARSCPAVDLIATEEEDEGEEQEQDQQRVQNRRQPLGQLVEESLVDGDDDDESEDEAPEAVDNKGSSSHLLDVMAKVVANADDVRGRFCQLVDFEAQVDRLNAVLENRGGKNAVQAPNRRNSRDSMAAIERVLECFDFLDKELEGSDDESEKKRHSVMIGSVTRDPKTDAALEIHLETISRLLEDIGSFGPLKERETRAIAELSRQAFALRVLLDFSDSESSSDSTQWKFADCDASAVWRCIPRTSRDKGGIRILATKADVIAALTPKALEFWRGGDHRLGPFLEFVFKRIRGNGVGSLNCAHQLTVFQFRDFFTGKRVVPCLLDLAKEYDLISDVSGDNPEYGELDRKGKSKQERRRKEAFTSMASMKVAPPAGAVLAASHLLCLPTTAGCDLARRYFASVVTHHPPPVRTAVEKVLLEALESKDERDREGGCRGLAIIGPGSKTIAPLAFLANSDPSHAVRRASKEALILMGEEGQNALTQAVLSSHGFQGLCVP